MSSILHNVPDVTTFAANVVVFLAAISAAVVGAMQAVKAIKKSVVEAMTTDQTTVTKREVIGGILQDQYGAIQMSEAIRDLKEAVCDLRTTMGDNTRENHEIRHILERVLDRMPPR